MKLRHPGSALLFCFPIQFNKALPCLLAGLGLLAGVRPAAAQGTAFSYQGQLIANGSPANGAYDFRFKLYFDPLGNNQAGLSFLTNGVVVTGGLFSVPVDFGAGIFSGSNYWLEVDVRANNAGSYTALSPLQAVTPTPYAIFAITASNLSGTLPAAQLSGAVPGASLSGIYGGAVTFSNASGTFSGNGSGLTGVNAATLAGLSGGSFWQLGGNVATTPGANYVGTADNQPLEFHVDATRALRIEPGGASAALGIGIPNGAPNMVGGSAFNFAAAGVVGATIGDGGATNYSGAGTNSGQAFANSVASGFGTIGGGDGNTIESNSISSTIGGGIGNVIQANVGYAVIPGGSANVVAGSYGFAAGQQAQALHQGAVVWADSQNSAFASTTNDQFNVRARGGVRFTGGTGSADQMVSWTPGSGSWSFSSDRNLKDRFEPVDEGSVLDKVCRLPLAEWSYKGYAQRHIGAMAQDFHALFPMIAKSGWI
jgi:hypothetical protein